MNSNSYGTHEYYVEEANRAELENALVLEAINARMIAGRVRAEDIKMYYNLIQGEMGKIEYLRAECIKRDKEEVAD